MTTARVERRLAAILAADVVGYSRLMERDEAGTVARLKAIRKELVAPLLAEHRGRVVKLMGDGALCEFASVVDAATCAVTIQRGMAEREAGTAEEERVRLRIGINLGDVIREEDGDLYGDGVNVAARLEQVAEPGGIVLSGTAADHLQGKLDYGLASLGELRLKNIGRPVRAYRVELGADVAAPAAVPSSPDKPAVAVLPFDNLSGDPEQAYFSDGITEDVITELARFRELLVIARNSSFAFRGKAVDVREIGRMLGVAYVVEGSVRRAGDRVRITAQLIEATTGAHLWAERYDRPLEDVFAIQDEVARGIVSTVAARVLEESELAARRRPPRDMRAYDLFLQGYRLSDVDTPEAQDRARTLFERARAVDPTFARAYTGLAFNNLIRTFDTGRPTSLSRSNLNQDKGRIGRPSGKDPDRREALKLAEQAVALDPNDARTHYALGYLCLVWRDFDRARRHLDLARVMNPNDAQIQMAWAYAQACLGDAERGLPAAELALRLNPRHARYYLYWYSRVLFLARRHDDARALLERITIGDPLRHPRDLGWWAAACGHLGREEEARRCAGWFVEAMREAWRGDPAAGPAEYVDWLVERSLLRRAEDAAHLREGLRLAGLPA
ncbi:MAG: adenylate/guanylate cyclase domain-containing protein [Geminicoccaceae bacterium]